MNQRNSNVRLLSLLFILGVQNQYSNANLYGGPINPPNPRTNTSGPATALFSLVDAEKQYAFISSEQQVPVLGVARAVYQGAPGSSASLEILDVIGITGFVKCKAYFFNTVSPKVISVKNDNSTVDGFPNLFGYLFYQAFEAIAADCNYDCNACATSALNNDPSQIQNAAGKTSLNFHSIQSVSLVATKETPTPALFQHVQKTLSDSGASAYKLQVDKQCVKVIKSEPFLLSCPVINKKLTNAALENAILNPVFQQKNQFCSYIISQCQLLNQQSQPVFNLYRAIIPTVCNSVAVVSFYSTIQLFNTFSIAVITYCG